MYCMYTENEVKTHLPTLLACDLDFCLDDAYGKTSKLVDTPMNISMYVCMYEFM